MTRRINVYRTYHFIDKDPMIDHARTMLADSGLSVEQASQLSGVTVLRNWFYGDTRQPKNATLTAFTTAMGYLRADRLNERGQIEVRFVKARDWDYDKELERAAKWIANQGKRRRRRKNGATK